MALKKLGLLSVLAIVAACGQATTETEAAASPAASTEAAAASTAAITGVPSGTYNIEPTHAYITFTYDHQGYSKPYLRFDAFTADLELDVEDPAASSVSVVIDAASINSNVTAFDEHLNSPDFFDTAQFPEITFVSTDLEVTGENTGVMTGDLTAKGITKPVTLDVTFNKAGFYDRANRYKIGFSARGTLMRSDWNLGLYVPYVGDKVDLVIETEFLRDTEGKD